MHHPDTEQDSYALCNMERIRTTAMPPRHAADTLRRGIQVGKKETGQRTKVASRIKYYISFAWAGKWKWDYRANTIV